MSVGDDAIVPKPSHVGDCPECGHKHPYYRTCSGGLTACGGPREGCPLCPRPVPVAFVEPEMLPIPITPIAIDATYVPSETPLPGRYRSWITEHDREHVTITHGTTRLSVTMLNHDLSRSEREAMIPKLVDAIERIIDEAEGG